MQRTYVYPACYEVSCRHDQSCPGRLGAAIQGLSHPTGCPTHMQLQIAAHRLAFLPPRERKPRGMRKSCAAAGAHLAVYLLMLPATLPD